MARARSADRIKAEELYLEHKGNIELIKIAEILDRPDGTVRGWKNKDNWDKKLNGTFQKKVSKNTERSKRKKGGQPDNKNATGNSGGSAPVGNLNAIKHGAYQSIYADMLNEEDKTLYEKIDSTANIDEEIKLIRLKIARLLNTKESFFYSPFGDKITKELTEEERIAGINACMDQLRRLIETKATNITDTEKLQLEKDKFEFQKYKSEIELQIKKEKLELEKEKVNKDKGINIGVTIVDDIESDEDEEN